MSRARVGGLLAACLATGCIDGVALPPPFEGPVGTLVLVAGADGDDPVMYVQKGSDLAAALAWPRGEVLAMGFEAAPDGLQIPPGLLHPDAGGPRPFPTPDQVSRGGIEGGMWRWAPGALPDGLLERFQLPEWDANECVEAGGCLSGPPSAVVCTPTCEIEAVVPPALPTPTCPATWSPGADGLCRPVPPPMGPCPDGERFQRAAQACLPIVECPAERFFVPADLEAPVYVWAGAVGGDGAEEAPYGTLEEAWARGGDIVHGAGE